MLCFSGQDQNATAFVSKDKYVRHTYEYGMRINVSVAASRGPALLDKNAAQRIVDVPVWLEKQ